MARPKKDPPNEMREKKMILGVAHVQIMCSHCKGMVWVQYGNCSTAYMCHTCTDPKEVGVGRHLPAKKNDYEG